ncbi:hypothetical protein MRX96_015047 [Rhipicephalus microplus]
MTRLTKAALVFDPLGGPFAPNLSDCQTMGQSCATHATLHFENPEGDVLLQELADGKREMLEIRACHRPRGPGGQKCQLPFQARK